LRTVLLVLAASVALFPGLGCRPQTPEAKSASVVRRPAGIVVVPLGDVPDNAVESTVSALKEAFNLPVETGASTALPRSAYYEPRDRFRADKLIPFLKTLGYPTDRKVVGVTNFDISTTARGQYDWGVFGLGSLGGETCIVSTFRLTGPGSKSPVERLADVVVHEVGHTLGLPHCKTPKCLMSDAGGSIKTVDTSTGRFCTSCRGKLGAIVR